MEYLDSRNVTLLNSVDDPWELSDIKVHQISDFSFGITSLNVEVVLRDVAKIHSSFLTKQEWLTSQYWLDVESTERMMRWVPLWPTLIQHAEKAFPEMWTKDK